MNQNSPKDRIQFSGKIIFLDRGSFWDSIGPFLLEVIGNDLTYKRNLFIGYAKITWQVDAIFCDGMGEFILALLGEHG